LSLERFAINNELSKLKYSDPEGEIREGFYLSKRINSLLRYLYIKYKALSICIQRIKK
jgi:hypothetical protein